MMSWLLSYVIIIQLSICANGLALIQSLPPSAFSSSSIWDGTCEAHDCKFSGTGWCAKTGNNGEWLQVNLGDEYVIKTISTKGLPNENEWVKTYTIDYKRTIGQWIDYPNELTGNTDKNTAVNNALSEYIIAQYIIFYPETWHSWPSMRIEVYGYLYTESPSAAPTINPTTPPTPAPTINPTLAPTINPTSAPSISPTQPPSVSPSLSPTTPPSDAPSTAPSMSPTIAPSLSPTACFDANNNISSIDGYEQTINDKVSNLNVFNNTLPNSIITVSKTGELYGHTFNNFSNYENQQLICNGVSSCLLSSIKFENNSVCNLLCNNTLSCSNSVVNITECVETRIVCNGRDACNSMDITITTHNSYKIDIDCGMISSCNNMVIDIIGNGYSDIQCFDLNSCDHLQVNIMPQYYKNNYLHMYSHSNNVVFNNGFGYEEIDGSTQYIECNTINHFIRWNNSVVYSNEMIEPLALNEYGNNLFPCHGVKVECFATNDTNETSDCTMNFNADISEFVINSPSSEAECYWVSVSEVTRISCTGTCVTSPTYAPSPSPTNMPTTPTNNPTNAPSISPTIAPSITPSIAPSLNPSLSPSITPTLNPTTPPSISPSIVPTLNPSLSPSIAPSISPTLAPSFAPSISPTLSPSFAPSIAPSIAPSQTPSVSPSNAPTQPPSISPSVAPTISPSHSPSNNPSISPTYSPSNSPSNVPTNEPTNSPTHHPIAHKDFDSYIKIKYQLEFLTQTNKETIANHARNVTEHVGFIVKNDYFFENVISYEHFMVSIEDIDGTQIDEIDTNNFNQWLNMQQLVLNSKIECNENDNGVNFCASIQAQSQLEADFDDRVTNDLQVYFDNDDLIFSVLNSNSLKVICKHCFVPQKIDILLIVLGVIVGMLICIAFCANLFNNGMFPQGPGFTVVDNGDWVSIIIFAIQFWDIASDLNLSIEIWRTGNLFDSDNILLLIAAIGSTICIIVPYSANLIIAANIKRFIKDNSAAKGWFQEYAGLFTCLVVLCGGCYPALCVVSSNVFGLNITTSGLTQYELKQMGKIKVCGTVILENVPQLMFQALYAYTTGITDAVALAFVASLLSVTASTLSYLIEIDTSDTTAVQYYLFTKCSERQINDSEKQKFIANRGRTWAMAEQMAEVFGIPNKNIECGYSMLTKHGIITHIIHFVHSNDLVTMEEELKETGTHAAVTASFFVSQLYASLKNDINTIFRMHFELSDEFDVEYASMRFGMKKRTMSNYKFAKDKLENRERIQSIDMDVDDIQNEEKKETNKIEKKANSPLPNLRIALSLPVPKANETMHKRRGTVLKNIAIQMVELGGLSPHSPLHSPRSPSESLMNENKIMTNLHKYFAVKGIKNQQEQFDFLKQLLINKKKKKDNGNGMMQLLVNKDNGNDNDEVEIIYEDDNSD